MRWQGRSSHPKTSTAGSQLSWATPHLLHKSTASWQHTSPSAHANQKISVAVLACLAFDSTRAAARTTSLHKEGIHCISAWGNTSFCY